MSEMKWQFLYFTCAYIIICLGRGIYNTRGLLKGEKKKTYQIIAFNNDLNGKNAKADEF